MTLKDCFVASVDREVLPRGESSGSRPTRGWRVRNPFVGSTARRRSAGRRSPSPSPPCPGQAGGGAGGCRGCCPCCCALLSTPPCCSPGSPCSATASCLFCLQSQGFPSKHLPAEKPAREEVSRSCGRAARGGERISFGR